jgi:2-dehydropantoate 2-reductase
MSSHECTHSPVLIIGTGAMACLFAARLAASGTDIIMLGSWPEGIEALRTRGVRIIDNDGTIRSFPIQVVNDLSQFIIDLSSRRIKLALVLVKSWQTERAAKQLKTCLDQEGLALTLQNGLGNYEVLVEQLGEDRVALGVTTTGATLIEPGFVKPVGRSTISLSEHPRLSPLIGIFRFAGFQTEIVPDMESLQWGKLLINAVINPLTALLCLPNGELLRRPAARALIVDIVQEVAAVAAAQGINLPYSDGVAAVENVAQQTATNSSSMLRDVQRAAQTEIDVINGAIIKAGQHVNIPTPINLTLLQLVKAMVNR